MTTRRSPPAVRALPFALGLGGAALVGTSAILRAPCLPGDCPPTPWLRLSAVVIAGGVAGLGGGYAAYLAVEEWTRAALAHPLGRLVFAPSRATLVGLAVVWTVAVVLARPLFSGALGVREGAWLVLAVPYYPFLVVSGLATAVLWQFDVWILGDASGSRWPVAVALLVVAAWVGLVAEVVWLYLLAAVIGRVTRVVHRVVPVARALHPR